VAALGGTALAARPGRFGAAKREFRMDTISNHRITPQEFAAWRKVCAADRVKVPTPSECHARHERTKRVVTTHQVGGTVNALLVLP
jgi:Plus-3 domain